jgi:hypothetical protein
MVRMCGVVLPELYKMFLLLVQDVPKLSCDMIDDPRPPFSTFHNTGYLVQLFSFYDWEEMKKCKEVLYSLLKSSNNVTAEDCICLSYVPLSNYNVPHVPCRLGHSED